MTISRRAKCYDRYGDTARKVNKHGISKMNAAIESAKITKRKEVILLISVEVRGERVQT